MMVRFSIILCMLISMGNISFGQNSRFYIKSKVTGSGDPQRVAGTVTYFSNTFENLLKEKYPCAKVTTDEDITTIMGHQRQKALLSSDTESGINDLGNALGCDFLISLEVGLILDQQFVVSAALIPYRKIWDARHFTAHCTYTSTSGNQILDKCEEVARQVVEALKTVEVCAFKGAVNVHVVTAQSDKKHQSYPVYCNQKDGIHLLDITTNKNSDAIWRLNRSNRNQLSGSIVYELSEHTDIKEQDDCYTCKSGRQGARSYTENVSATAKIEGLSNESISDAQRIPDARAEIHFLEDGTYTLTVLAASKNGILKRRVEKHAEGTCDNIQAPPESHEQKADIPLNETFGPFPGTSVEKELTQKNVLTRTDPVTKEMTTISFDFNLKRD